jgi:hypothetical protein
VLRWKEPEAAGKRPGATAQGGPRRRCESRRFRRRRCGQRECERGPPLVPAVGGW